MTEEFVIENATREMAVRGDFVPNTWKRVESNEY